MIIPPIIEAHGTVYVSVDHIKYAMRSAAAHGAFSDSLSGGYRVPRDEFDGAIYSAVNAALKHVPRIEIAAMEPRA